MAVIPPWAPGYGPDSIMGQTQAGLVLEDPVHVEAAPPAPGSSMSWIYLTLMLLFCIVGVRVKSSPRYFIAMVRDLTNTRERQNVFDDTVKETSFLVVLNLLWSACAGVLLWGSLALLPSEAYYSFSIPDRPAAGIALCMGVAVLYNVGMLLAYTVVGNVFADARRTGMWVRGAAASTGLETIVFFPVALLMLAQPEWTRILLIIAAGAFILGKIMFILKGFRIFFTKFTSLLLFLYYLCSLEIVPLILTYVLTLQICSEWL